MEKAVILADTAILSLKEIADYRKNHYERQGFSHTDAIGQARNDVEQLIDHAVEAISNPLVDWGYDGDMASMGFKIRRWYDNETHHYCFFDDAGDEIEVLYFSHDRQNYLDALYRLITVYTYVPYFLPDVGE